MGCVGTQSAQCVTRKETIRHLRRSFALSRRWRELQCKSQVNLLWVILAHATEEGEALFRLVLVVESENAVQALRQMDHPVTTIQAPKVTREAVVAFYGEEAATIYDECDGSTRRRSTRRS